MNDGDDEDDRDTPPPVGGIFGGILSNMAQNIKNIRQESENKDDSFNDKLLDNYMGYDE